jgi:hypothetical protein
MVTVAVVVAALVVGVGLGYGFRGKINKGVTAAGTAVKTDIGTVTKKL